MSIIDVALGNPVTSAVRAALGTLTNPFIEDRVDPSRRYHKARLDSFVGLWTEVKNCKNCQSSIDREMHRDGETWWSWVSNTNYKQVGDSHCPMHWDIVKKYQLHYINSQKS